MADQQKGGKKGKKKAQAQPLHEFLGAAPSGSWADDEPEPFADTPEDSAQNSNDWRGGGGGGGVVNRPFAPAAVQREIRERRNEQRQFPTSPPFTLYVGNLPYDADEDSISAWFKDRGLTTKQVRLIIDREKNAHKGYCYVELHTLDDLKAALGHNEEEFKDSATGKGRRLRLDLASDNNRNRGGMASMDRGDFGGSKQGGFGGGGGGFEGFNRNDMGQSQPSSDPRGGRGDRPRPGPAGQWDRDALGSAQQPQMGGGGANMDRGSWGEQSQQQQRQPRDAWGAGRPEREEQPPLAQPKAPNSMAGGRDAWGENKVQQPPPPSPEGAKGAGAGAGSWRSGGARQPGNSPSSSFGGRDTWGSEKVQQPPPPQEKEEGASAPQKWKGRGAGGMSEEASGASSWRTGGGGAGRGGGGAKEGGPRGFGGASWRNDDEEQQPAAPAHTGLGRGAAVKKSTEQQQAQQPPPARKPEPKNENDWSTKASSAQDPAAQKKKAEKKENEQKKKDQANETYNPWEVLGGGKKKKKKKGGD
eukprot:TRINITY_DN31359_c0_g1_i1.p1 TRINITY_DN31359_c0_g1~~TRINITY_DN31359_c0_g1_i1.p1  ORF type:complete len:554 (+),score=106.77 TRINITY_DN31359_c0_g1_i1:74-1663(+)